MTLKFKAYKMWVKGHVVWTHDKVTADFMNKDLKWWQRILLWFMV